MWAGGWGMSMSGPTYVVRSERVARTVSCGVTGLSPGCSVVVRGGGAMKEAQKQAHGLFVVVDGPTLGSV